MATVVAEKRVPVDKLLARFDIDLESGILRWKPIEVLQYRDKIWNTKNAGKIAGNANQHGLLQISPIIDGVKYCLSVHRVIYLAANGRWPEGQLDHKDHDRSKNGISDTRDASHSKNMRNKRLYRKNTSGYKGVTWYPKLRKWASKLGHNKKLLHLGYFYDPRDAALAYDQAALKYHGDFAQTNAMLGLL